MIIKKYKEILESFFSKEAIVMKIKERIPYIFNSSAMKIWKLLNHKPRTLNYLIDQFSRGLRVGKKTNVRKDVLNFIKQLSKRKLIIIRGENNEKRNK